MRAVVCSAAGYYVGDHAILIGGKGNSFPISIAMVDGILSGSYGIRIEIGAVIIVFVDILRCGVTGAQVIHHGRIINGHTCIDKSSAYHYVNGIVSYLAVIVTAYDDRQIVGIAVLKALNCSTIHWQ